MKQRTAKKIRSKKDTICCKTQGEGEKIFRPLILKTGGKIYMKLVYVKLYINQFMRSRIKCKVV